MPYFSIVMPVHNREKLVVRAIDSCLRQDFRDFELIIVDDASTDNTRAVVRGYGDKRIQLVRHDINRGAGPARNSGFAKATGDWVVCLDSDDELAPGALSVIDRRTQEVDDKVGGLRFMCLLDDGAIAPEPPLVDEVWDYAGYIRWVATLRGGREETMPVVRRETFEEVRYPDNQANEALYHMDFARAYRIRACADVVRLYHCDADTNVALTNSPQKIEVASHRGLLIADDIAKSTDILLVRHGEALARLAPMLLSRLEAGAATQHFLAGRRVIGLRYGLRSLKRKPFSVQRWAVILFGLLGARPLNWLKATRLRAKIMYERFKSRGVKDSRRERQSTL